MMSATKRKGRVFLFCSAQKCTNNSHNNRHLKFFSFPKEEERAKKWVILCERGDLIEKDATYLNQKCKVCSEHFEEKAYVNFIKNRLKLDAVPTLFNKANEMPRKRKAHKEMSSQIYDSDEESEIDSQGSNKAESESGATSEDREEMSRSDEPMPEVGPGFGSLYDAVDALREISNQNKDSNQFHAFAHHVAVQLEQLPLEDALMLQSEIQNLITSKRVQVLRDGRATMVSEEIDIKPLILPDS